MAEGMEKPIVPKTSIELELEELEAKETARLAAERPRNLEILKKLIARLSEEHVTKPRMKITGEMRKEAKRNQYTDGNVD